MIALPFALLALVPVQADGWIEQLRSDSPERRHAAVRALEDLGEPARAPLTAALGDKDAEVASAAKEVLATLDRYRAFDALVVDYRGYGLPFPPEGAVFVRCPMGVWSVGARGKLLPHWTLGFRSPAPPADKTAELLLGTVRRSDEEPELSTPVRWDASIDADLEAASTGNFQLNSLLATAVQCHALGHPRFALALFDWALAHTQPDHDRPDRRPGPDSPKTALAILAWTHWLNHLSDPGDRGPIARVMERLIKTEPRLDTPVNVDILESLKAALKPTTSKPGSMESLVDDLVAMPGPVPGVDRPAPMLKLIGMGFDAVPVLVDHLTDPRLTHYSRNDSFHHFAMIPWHVQALVLDLLADLAGSSVVQSWMADNVGKAEVKSRALAWLSKAREKGEQKVLVDRVLEDDRWPDAGALRVIRMKYPEDLDAIYRRLLEQRHGMESHPLADAVAESALPTEKKVEILSRAARHQDSRHCYAALYAVQRVDKAAGVRLLAAALDGLPDSAKESPAERSISYLGLIVRGSDDPRAWDALARAARRVDVSLRLRFLEMVTWKGTKGEVRKQQLRFLASFLQDETASTEPDERSTYFSAKDFPRIEVRNAAALMITETLELEPKPDSTWGVAEWALLRKKVAEKLGL